MKFTCPRCGKKYASADEPAPGRVYSLTCRCGTKITVKGPGAEPTPPPSSAPSFDPFPSERRRVHGGAPLPSLDPGPLPSSRPEPASSSTWSGRSSQTQRVPLQEVTPPGRRAPASSRPVAPRVAPKPAAPLDPFADMPDLQAEARGDAKPLTTVPEIRGPLPESPASYDPFAAQQGLLLDEQQARSIAGQAPILEPRVDPAPSEDGESPVTFSEQIPAPPPKRRPRAVVPKVASRGPGRMILFAVGVAVIGGGAGAAWLFLGRTRSTPPTQAVARPIPAEPPRAPAPVPLPPPPAVATPAPAPVAAPPAPAPAPPPVAQAQAPAPPQVASPPPAPAPRAEPPPSRAHRKAESRRAQRHAAATPPPEPAPRKEPERAAPPPPPPPPPPAPKEEPPKKAAQDKAMLDLLAKKQDSGPTPPAGRAVRTELTSAEVGASIKASAKAFDACVGEAARNEPNLQVVGRRVGLYITVNPSGLVTGPRLDDADLDDSVLGACLKATARKMVFPAFQGEAFQVRIPMVLGAGR